MTGEWWLRVPCPDHPCRAPVGVRCTFHGTRRPDRAHTQRYVEAAKQQRGERRATYRRRTPTPARQVLATALALVGLWALATTRADAQTTIINPSDARLQWAVDVCTPNCAATGYDLSAVRTIKDVLVWVPLSATKVGEVMEAPVPALADGTWVLNLRGRNALRPGPASDPLVVSVLNGAKAPGKPTGFKVIVIGEGLAVPPPEPE